MPVIKGHSVHIENERLREDAFKCLVIQHKFLTSQLDVIAKDTRFYNYKRTYRDYWGIHYENLSYIVKLPPKERKHIIYSYSREKGGLGNMFLMYKDLYAVVHIKRKHKESHLVLDKLNKIFFIEDEEGVVKWWRYLVYCMFSKN
jgi:hypothetical protein